MGKFRDVIEYSVLTKISDGKQDIWQSSINFLNGLGWQLSWSKRDNKCSLYSQNYLVFISHEWLVLQSFVYGIVYSTLRASILMKTQPAQIKRTQVVDNNEVSTQQANHSLIVLFDELILVSEYLFSFEKSFTAFARSASLYRTFQKKQYDPKYAQQFEEFAKFYERKLALEAVLKSSSEDGVSKFKFAARNLIPIRLNHLDRLPVALAFIFLHLEQDNSTWYQHQGNWYYFEGDQLIFSANDRDDFEGFMSGMAYNYAKLPDEVLEQYIRDPLRHRRKG